MKERSRKQKFLKNFDLQFNRNPRPIELENENPICERLCFYYIDDDAQVICRGCYKSFKFWLEYRMHFTTILCHITEAAYKLNTYNEVYKKYKLRKAKTKKRINDRLSAAQLMDLETLNTRKTRKRCYNNTRVANNISKSSYDSGFSNSEKITTKTIKKESPERVSSDENVANVVKPRINGDSSTTQIHVTPKSTKTNIPIIPQDNQSLPTIKTELIADDVSLTFLDDQLSSSIFGLSNDRFNKNNTIKFNQYVCVICDEQFSRKSLLTLHQVQHIKSDRSCYRVFMAALTARSA